MDGATLAVIGLAFLFGMAWGRWAERRRAAKAKPAPMPAQSIRTPQTIPLPEADLLLQYRDSKGAISERLITVHSLDGFTENGRFTGEHLHAYCHTRKAARTFRCDRIESLADSKTGEVFPGLSALTEHISAHLQQPA